MSTTTDRKETAPSGDDRVGGYLRAAVILAFALAVAGLALPGAAGRVAAWAMVVTLVSLLVQVYSLSYLDGEPAPSLGRYYTYQSLFAFSISCES